ncbi:unnamed protein product [Closterium sp. NIES-53]
MAKNCHIDFQTNQSSVDESAAEMVNSARIRLNYVASLVTECESVCPPSVGVELALGSYVLEDRHFELECLAATSPRFPSMLLCPEGDLDALDIPTPCYHAKAIAGEYSPQWQTAIDVEMASWKPTSLYVDEVPPPRANIVDGMWIFRVKRPPCSPPVLKACYVARGFSQRKGVDFFHTFSPTPKMTTLWMLLHVAVQGDYELHSLDFPTAFLLGSLHEEIWLRRPPGFTGSFPACTQWSLGQPVYGLRQAPREWHETMRTTLVALGFAPSTADPSLFLSTDTTLPPFYILAELQERHTCTDLGPSALCLPILLAIAHSSVYQPLALSSAFGRVLHREWGSCLEDRVQWYSQDTPMLLGPMTKRLTVHHRVTPSVLALELRWLTYLLTNLGERPHSPPVLYVDNKAMLALCHEQRLEHRTKQIALRFFLARELQQCRQLRLSYVASWANTADVFTKALGSGDHQRFYTALGLVPTLPHLLIA